MAIKKEPSAISIIVLFQLLEIVIILLIKFDAYHNIKKTRLFFNVISFIYPVSFTVGGKNDLKK